jgi:hypothetical protein
VPTLTSSTANNGSSFSRRISISLGGPLSITQQHHLDKGYGPWDGKIINCLAGWSNHMGSYKAEPSLYLSKGWCRKKETKGVKFNLLLQNFYLLIEWFTYLLTYSSGDQTPALSYIHSPAAGFTAPRSGRRVKKHTRPSLKAANGP